MSLMTLQPVSTPRLFRNRLIQSMLHSIDLKKRVILIEAQAGQGKSTLAGQLLEHIQTPYAWHSIGSEDRDPVAFIERFHSALRSSIPEIKNSTLQKLIIQGEVIAQNLDRFAEMLNHDLSNFCKSNFFIVFDDMHLIENPALTLTFIQTLIETSPPQIKFILISRRPSKINVKSEMVLWLGNEDLALSPMEIADLYARIFKVSLSTDDTRNLLQTTEGWMMGLILIGHHFADNTAQYAMRYYQNALAQKSGDIQNYFREEILAGFSPNFCKTLLKLSLLENVPLPLAERLSRDPNISIALRDLAERNYFVRCTDNECSTYVFHHFFQECLRTEADKNISRSRQSEILTQAGEWFHAHERQGEALRCYLRAENYSMAEKVLRKAGLDFLDTNRMITLQTALEKIPLTVIQSHAWLLFYYGVVHFTSDPAPAFAYLNHAKVMFAKQNEDLGELLTITSLITYYIGIDCKYRKGKKLLPRAEQLFSILKNKMSVSAHIRTTFAIVYGHCYFRWKTQLAEKYLNEIQPLARMKGLADALSGVAVARGFKCGFEGDWGGFSREIEDSFHYLHASQVSEFNKHCLLMMPINFAEMKGDFLLYEYHKALLRVEYQDLAEKTLIGAFIYRLDMDAALADGLYEDVLLYGQQGLKLAGSGASAHLQSQYRCYLAYALALTGDTENALLSAELAVKLRLEAGGTFYRVLTQMMIGGVYAQLKIEALAERYLSQSILASKYFGDTFIRAGAHAHRAFLRLEIGKEADALDDIRSCLTCLKTKQHVHFFSWNPRLMQRVLIAAIHSDIETDYASMLLTDRLGLSVTFQGQIFPIMEIVTLGGLELKLKGVGAISSIDLTPAQRELLSLLISGPHQSMPQEQIQEILWPNSPPERGRANFDNMLSRLRKVLSQAFKPYSVNHYLVLEKGILHLQNCRIDALEFLTNIRKGRAHLQRQEFWNAGNAYYLAHRLFSGEFLAGIRLKGDTATFFQEDLLALYLESAAEWINILKQFDRTDQAIQVLETAIRFDPIDEPLVRTLYDLYAKSGQTAKAHQVLRRYKRALAEADHSPDEVDQIMESFWNP